MYAIELQSSNVEKNTKKKRWSTPTHFTGDKKFDCHWLNQRACFVSRSPFDQITSCAQSHSTDAAQPEMYVFLYIFFYTFRIKILHPISAKCHYHGMNLVAENTLEHIGPCKYTADNWTKYDEKRTVNHSTLIILFLLDMQVPLLSLSFSHINRHTLSRFCRSASHHPPVYATCHII